MSSEHYLKYFKNFEAKCPYLALLGDIGNPFE